MIAEKYISDTTNVFLRAQNKGLIDQITLLKSDTILKGSSRGKYGTYGIKIDNNGTGTIDNNQFNIGSMNLGD